MKSTIILPKGTRTVTLEKVMTFLRGLAQDKAWTLEIRPYSRERSNQQNAALWGHAYKVFAEFVGLQGEEEIKALHSRLCEMYFGRVSKDILGEAVNFPRRTTTTNEHGKRETLSTVDFKGFYDFVARVAAEHGCYIPDPDPEWFMREQVA